MWEPKACLLCQQALYLLPNKDTCPNDFESFTHLFSKHFFYYMIGVCVLLGIYDGVLNVR